MKEYFDYDGAAHMVYRDEYANADWEKMIYDELAAKRPVYLSGTSVSGTSVVGHAFVCDGYDGEGLFHINWGWGGMSDGFFRLTLLNPSDHGTGGNNGSGDTTWTREPLSAYNPTRVALLRKWRR